MAMTMAYFAPARLLRSAGLGITVALALATMPHAAEDYDPETAFPTCEPGKVYDSLIQICVDPAPGVVSDRMFWEYAYVLARFDRSEEADSLLGFVADQSKPRFLNVRGYVSRKLGRVEESIDYYLKAIELEPDYVNARSYLGEAYLMQGNVELARTQLAEIEKICGNTCEPYFALLQAIREAQTN